MKGDHEKRRPCSTCEGIHVTFASVKSKILDRRGLGKGGGHCRSASLPSENRVKMLFKDMTMKSIFRNNSAGHSRWDRKPTRVYTRQSIQVIARNGKINFNFVRIIIEVLERKHLLILEVILRFVIISFWFSWSIQASV